MPFRRRKPRLASIKTAIQHSDTQVANIGGASTPTEMVILATETGNRTTSGATQTTKSFADTSALVQIGDIVKYVNLFIEAGARSSVSQIDSSGFLEWALIMVKESETALPITQLGTKTLGDVATKMYRNETIYTGNIPIGLAQPNGTSITIKVPKFKQKIRIGDEWRFVCYFRDLQVTSVGTDSVRLITSCMYKSYS